MKQLTHDDWSLTLDMSGGRIQELSHSGVKIFGTYHRRDGKTGNTHVCSPNFDKEGQYEYGLPFHGYARALEWVEKPSRANTIEITALTTPSELYPAQLELKQIFSLENTFVHSVEVRNLQGREVPVNIAIHYYWDTPKGWNDVTINNTRQTENVRTNGYIDLVKDNTIVFPHARYELISHEFHSAVLWTSFVSENDSISYSHDFCCIEPVVGWPGYFGSKESMVYVGESKKASISIVPQEGLEPPSL